MSTKKKSSFTVKGKIKNNYKISLLNKLTYLFDIIKYIKYRLALNINTYKIIWTYK